MNIYLNHDFTTLMVLATLVALVLSAESIFVEWHDETPGEPGPGIVAVSDSLYTVDVTSGVWKLVEPGIVSDSLYAVDSTTGVWALVGSPRTNGTNPQDILGRRLK